jgi:hypothetical protein
MGQKDGMRHRQRSVWGAILALSGAWWAGGVVGEQANARSTSAATAVCIAKAGVALQYRSALDEPVSRSGEVTHDLQEQTEGEVEFPSRILPQPVNRFATETAQVICGGTTAEFQQRAAQRVAVVRREPGFAFAVATGPVVLAYRRLSARECRETVRLADDRLALFDSVLTGTSSPRCEASRAP